MNKIALLLIISLSLSTSVFSQNFEGIIEMYQVTANGLEYDLKWYIKNDKIAYELSPKSSRSTGQMRFVPQKSSNTMLMVIGDNKTEIPATEITSPSGFNMKGAKLQEKGTISNPNFKEVKVYEIATNEVVSIVEVTTDIKINFADYAAFFKADYAICALAESGKIGFPLNSITKDKNGNVLTQTTFKKITKIEVPDAVFK